ncbi:MAG: amino acid dehydrogenase [Bacteroidia bacterium]|nr:amino acid dehydrogenase [Bacteroidia bacterium]
MLSKLKAFEHSPAEIVFQWNDTETEAKGWVVINSRRNGAAGGGTRMRKGCSLEEVLSLAKTMEIKFAVSGPPIGGAKSGIDFDPKDPRKEGVLKRWYSAVKPLLKNYYGTGGDMNVDEVHEVIPITRELGILHPQEGVVNGHIKAGDSDFQQIIENLSKGVTKEVTFYDYAPTGTGKVITVSDMITGYGVGMSVVHAYDLWKMNRISKRVVIQGFGNVGGAAALTLAYHGFRIVGIIDIRGGIIKEEGLSLEEVKDLYINREGNQLPGDNLISFEEANQRIWNLEAEVFVPAAGSRIVTREQIESMIQTSLEVVACGANVPFADKEIFLGPTTIHADNNCLVIPDFIANCGMARAFAYFMQKDAMMVDAAIFQDVSLTILRALAKTRSIQSDAKQIWQKSLEWVLEEIMPGNE